MKKHLPNALSCLNLFSGCIGIVMAFENNLAISSYIILFASVIDFFDGTAARMLKAYSGIGKQLDSLADIVSFGVLPATIMYQLFLRAEPIGAGGEYLSYTAYVIAVFSALRLAKFNIDERQTENFIGLSTPANALLISSLPMIGGNGGTLSNLLANTYFLVAFTLIMSFLLVAEIPLMGLKFKTNKVKDNLFRYILLISIFLLILFFQFYAFPVIFLLYLTLSFIQFRLTK
jgi:CDP-diacylglycerol--serine O-phosphatidyltransferase